MQYNVEALRFLNPDGEFIISPEGHHHAEVIREQKLSNKDGFEAMIELVCSGFALIAVCDNQIFISHSIDLSDAQIASINQLKQHLKEGNKSFQVCILQEDVA